MRRTAVGAEGRWRPSSSKTTPRTAQDAVGQDAAHGHRRRGAEREDGARCESIWRRVGHEDFAGVVEDYPTLEDSEVEDDNTEVREAGETEYDEVEEETNT